MKPTDEYYNALGIRHYVRRGQEVTMGEEQQVTTTAVPHWQQLQNQVNTCTACPLHQSRTHAVFGVGNTHADLMIIGEAPGYYEDQQGEPFVGRAGKLLNEMLKAISLTREQVYIANIIKCRPPNNRDPQVIEVDTCSPYLLQQINYIKPKLLLAVGRIAAHYLLKNKASLESLRQRVYPFSETNTPLIVTYHPAYLLRNLVDKKKAYMDLKFAKNQLEGIVNGGISATQ